MDEFAKVYNAAWSRNWGFVPYSAGGPRRRSPSTSSWSTTATGSWSPRTTGETVALAITIPDINQVLKKMNGRLLPFGWWHYLRRERIIDGVRVGFLGVLPEYQHTGAAACLYMEHYDVAAEAAAASGARRAGSSRPTAPMNRGWRRMGGRIVKRYRVYELELGRV